MRWLSTPIQTRFYEADSYRIVNNMFYLSWFELGRFAVAEKAGLVNERFDDEGYAFVVGRVEIDYLRPVRFLDRVNCDSVIAAKTGSKLRFDHKIKNAANHSVHAEGRTEVVLLRDAKMLLKLPAWIEESVFRYVSEEQGGYAP